jgi:hypothetical protein
MSSARRGGASRQPNKRVLRSFSPNLFRWKNYKLLMQLYKDYFIPTPYSTWLAGVGARSRAEAASAGARAPCGWPARELDRGRRRLAGSGSSTRGRAGRRGADRRRRAGRRGADSQRRARRREGIGFRIGGEGRVEKVDF